MQPRKLMMQNFGPFIHEQLDFGDFQEAGLFLISGKTGAGKTTIFDGMTFALFGETSGNLRSGKEMRANFATPEEETVVRFTFEHQRLLYEIERRPEQLLAKKKGAGLTKQTMKVCLTIFDAAGEELRQITKKTEVDQFIKDLLQLDAKQFFQIIMLPQGEFRNFLIATSNEKEKVLRNLFGTELYQRFNEWLKEQLKERQKQLEKQSVEVEHLASRFVWNKEQTVYSINETLSCWQADLGLWQTQFEQEQQTFEDLQLTKKQAQEKLLHCKEQHQAFEELTELTKKENQLAEQQQLVREWRRQQEELEWLTEHQALLTQCEQQRQEVAKLSGQLNENQQKRLLWQQQQAAWEAKRSEIDQLQADHQMQQLALQEVGQLLPLAQNVQNQTETVMMLEKAVKKAEKQLAKALAEKETQQQQQQELATILEKKEDYQQANLYLLRAEQGLEKWQAQQTVITKQVRQLAKLEKQADQIEEKIQAMTTAYEQAQVAFVQGKSEDAKLQIARLSLQLVPGEPCPVCGALEHPKAAQTQEVSLEEIRLSSEKLEQMENRLDEIVEQRTVLLTKQQQLKKQISETQEELANYNKQEKMLWQDLQLLVAPVMDETLAPENINERFEQIRTAQIDLAATLQKAEEQLKTLRASIIENQELENQKRQQLAEQNEEYQTETGKLKGLQEQLGAYTLDELKVRFAELEAILTEQTKTLIEDQHQQQTLREDQLSLAEKGKMLEQFEAAGKVTLKNAEAALTQALVEVGWTEETMQEKREGLLEKKQLTDKIKQYEQEVDFIKKRKQMLTGQLTNHLPEAVQQYETQVQQLEEEGSALQECLIQTKEILRQNTALYESLLQLYQENTQQIEETMLLQQLSETVNGENSLKTSLERYVLQQFLTEILEVANVRLGRLTRDRYQFQLADTVGSYRSSTGLEINIYDDNAGSARRAHTLSGGESFIAALALALSLADVIQNQSGGIAIEALFIDEGFGSLDEESLEMAMEALEIIENEGRIIGIISHVKELKDRVLQQVLVTTDGTGCSKIQTKPL